MIKKKSTFESRLSLLAHYLENFVFLRARDTLLCSFPKSGNTWLRVLYYHYLSEVFSKECKFSFRELDGRMPELGRSWLSKSWEYAPYPRVIKTHRAYSGWFRKAATRVLVVRAPEDTMVSYYAYATKLNTFVVDSSLSLFMRSSSLGLPAWMAYHEGWVPKAELVILYSELKSDTELVLEKFLDHLGVPVDRDAVARAVESSAFERVKKAEEKYGHTRPDEMSEGFRFARDGSIGQGKRKLSQDDLSYLEACWDRYDSLTGLKKMIEKA